MRILRRAAAMAALLMGAAGIQVVQGGAVQAALPTAAVALGDSFVSGEGAGDYQPVVDASGTAQATRDKFRALGAERYAAGCPIHRASLAPGHVFSQNLGSLVKNAYTTLAAERPTADLRVLDVQKAFDGARLCENPGSPTGALATPVRVQDGPTGTYVTSLSGWDKIGVQRVANTCVTYFQTCQEAWHPNAAGHTVLGQCLTGALTAAPRTIVTCVRNANGTLTIS
ncbi:hypothetical protein SAMN05216276_10206 [Streptosporangium subroseum]|uniref:GDSL-like Lipase/Acylhydrolase family protein n=1 Tax=Streptosporangium subroseum TaxID=106412 RepID=A0A239IMG3_9ACTN|nr:hypothetical protein [Streptosporangium subroseum]SNS94233.1 hypothetical protein SAMN05216276_10206 [Streptosporangium subroseum]